MAELAGLPNLVDRAARLLAERGAVGEAELVAAIFGGQSPGWVRLLERVLGSDERFERTGDGWQLRAQAPAAEPTLARPAVAIAVVTNGPQPFRHLPVAIAAIRFGESSPAEWYSLVRPERPVRLPGYLSEHGIDAESIEQAPTFAEIAPQLVDFIGDLPIVGLDVATAVAFLQFALRRAGLPQLVNPLIELAHEPLPAADTPGRRRPDLNRLARRYGVPAPTRRDAAAIARTVAAIADRIHDSAPPATPASRTVRRPRAIAATARRPLYDHRTLDTIPSQPGVYRFLAADGEVLYVGKATNLRERVASYVSSDVHRTRQMAGLAEATAQVETTPVQTPLEAALLELREIRQRTPRYNVQQAESEQLAYICMDLTEAAAWRSPRFRVYPAPEGACVGPLLATEARRIVALVRGQHTWPGGRKHRPEVAMARSTTAQAMWAAIVAAANDARLPGGLRPDQARHVAVCARGALGQPVAVLVGVAGYIGAVEIDETDDLARSLEEAFAVAPAEVTPVSLAELRLALRLAERSGFPIVSVEGDFDRIATEIERASAEVGFATLELP